VTGHSSPALVLPGAIVVPDGVVPDGVLVVYEGLLAYAGSRSAAPVPDGAFEADLPAGTLLLPGLVDLHCHGAAGAEFGADADASARAAEHHRRAGTTSVVTSLVSAPADDMVAGMSAAATLFRGGAAVAAHAEGPFLSPRRRGAQDPDALSAVDAGLVERMAEAADGALATMTFAPELPGADGLVEQLAALGVLPAIGHTDADAATVARSLGRIADLTGRRPLVTHLFNGMRPLHHRDPGPVAACLAAAARGEAVVELIADGVHLADETVAMVFDLVGADSVALVSDAMAACGMPEGRFRLGRLDVVVEGRTATLADGSSIAGGVATLLDVVRRSVREAGVDLVSAVRAATATPARVLGQGRAIGSLVTGMRADVLAVDPELRPVGLWRGGLPLPVPDGAP
jgi:N-acetylglucosamine-6-phosphate deacetylase